MQEAAYSYRQLNLFEICEEEQTANTPAFLYGRTCPAPFPQMGEWTFSPSLKKSGRPNFQYLKMENGLTPEWLNCETVKLRGECLTRNIGEYPNEESESSLSQILQKAEDVPQKYYLSAKACAGIIRRAAQRGKELPQELKTALEIQSSDYGQESPGGGKGALISKEKSLSLKSDNDQVLFIPDKARSLTARADGSPCIDRGPDVVAVYDIQHGDEPPRLQQGKSCCLTARIGQGGLNVPIACYSIAGNTIDRKDENGGNGSGFMAEKSYTLNTMDRHAVASFSESSFGTFREDGKSATLKESFGCIGGGSETMICGQAVRRLTPIECERLQGLPDNYTLIDDKTCSDSARYRALGNGMAQPCADWIIKRIAEVSA